LFLKVHPQGYTSGYFLGNSSNVAVLALNAFTDAASDNGGNSPQQAVIKQFLAASKLAGKNKLIIDLQGNGGGSVYNGFDAFKQIFPTVEPFGGSRFRSTPLVDYISNVYSNSGLYNGSSPVWQVQANVDLNELDFPNYKARVGSEEIHGDNFTALVRNNLSDTELTLANGIVVSGYANLTNQPAQLFESHNIILLHDGGCGSTCAIFAELMKSQGVRSIAVGGRPQNGPMQGTTGSKG